MQVTPTRTILDSAGQTCTTLPSVHPEALRSLQVRHVLCPGSIMISDRGARLRIWQGRESRTFACSLVSM